MVRAAIKEETGHVGRVGLGGFHGPMVGADFLEVLSFQQDLSGERNEPEEGLDESLDWEDEVVEVADVPDFMSQFEGGKRLLFGKENSWIEWSDNGGAGKFS